MRRRGEEEGEKGKLRCGLEIKLAGATGQVDLSNLSIG